jgi:hypothetical protein
MAVNGALNSTIPVQITATANTGADENTAVDPDAAPTLNLSKLYKITKSKGATVAEAKAVVMTSSALVVTFNGSGKLEPSNQTITFTVRKTNTTSVAGWGVAPFNGEAVLPVTNVLSSETGDSVTMTAAQFARARGSANGIHVSVSVDGMIERCSVLMLQGSAVNGETIVEAPTPAPTPTPTPSNAPPPPVNSQTEPTVTPVGSPNAVNPEELFGVLTNETHILATDASGNGGDFSGAGGTLRMFDGAREVTVGNNIVYSVAEVSEGLTIAVEPETGVYSVTALTTDVGTAQIVATYRETLVGDGGDIPPDGVGGGADDGNADPVSQHDDFITCRAKFGISDSESSEMENEFAEHPFGNSPEGLARQRAAEAGGMTGADPFDPGTNAATAEPAGCSGTANRGDEFQLSPRFKVSDLSSHNPNPHRIGNGNRRAGRATVICNLRHLCVNALEPIYDHFLPLGYTIVISHGYRGGGARSDHCIGSAVDLIFSYRGRRIGGEHLTRVQMCIDQHLRIPYTQMIHETTSGGNILHLACRRVGGNSGMRNTWSPSNGKNLRSGYKHRVSLDGNPRVR